MKRQDFSLRPLQESDLEQVLKWRNSDRVRNNMFESETIPWENHVKWFHSLHNNPYNKCLMFQYKGEVIGVITAKVVKKEEGRWIWGCYLGDKNIFPGAGTIMGFMALEYCFEDLHIKTLIGEAVAANEVSLKFNARIGFRTEKQFIQTTSTKREVPAILLELTNDEWKQKKPAMLEKFFNKD
jgi:UDP-4-amino-4,6-dideoxy-N-acetyl-beta-L-altrosamine N-acetyltransferase